jgi:hypothetical protein
MKKFAEIINKGECMTTLYQFPQIPWPQPFLKNEACKEEWAKTGFYPSNGLVGEIPFEIEKNMQLRIDIQIYILKINDTYYVPMTEKGLKFISEEEYNKRKNGNILKGMDDRQIKINKFFK